MKLTPEKIIAALEKYNISPDDYLVIGYRVDNISYNIGDYCADSKNFEGRLDDFNPETDGYDELDGTCATLISWDGEMDRNAMVRCCNFFDDQYIHIIASDDDGGLGTDPDEIIIRNAVVIGKIE